MEKIYLVTKISEDSEGWAIKQVRDTQGFPTRELAENACKELNRKYVEKHIEETKKMKEGDERLYNTLMKLKEARFTSLLRKLDKTTEDLTDDCALISRETGLEVSYTVSEEYSFGKGRYINYRIIAVANTWIRYSSSEAYTSEHIKDFFDSIQETKDCIDEYSKKIDTFSYEDWYADWLYEDDDEGYRVDEINFFENGIDFN